MDSLMQQIKAAPIAKETDVGNKKTKISKPSKFEAIFKEMKVSEEYTKKNTNSIILKTILSLKKITIYRQI
jgi:hypothetical protein